MDTDFIDFLHHAQLDWDVSSYENPLFSSRKSSKINEKLGWLQGIAGMHPEHNPLFGGLSRSKPVRPSHNPLLLDIPQRIARRLPAMNSVLDARNISGVHDQDEEPSIDPTILDTIPAAVETDEIKNLEALPEPLYEATHKSNINELSKPGKAEEIIKVIDQGLVENTKGFTDEEVNTATQGKIKNLKQFRQVVNKNFAKPAIELHEAAVRVKNAKDPVERAEALRNYHQMELKLQKKFAVLGNIDVYRKAKEFNETVRKNPNPSFYSRDELEKYYNVKDKFGLPDLPIPKTSPPVASVPSAPVPPVIPPASAASTSAPAAPTSSISSAAPSSPIATSPISLPTVGIPASAKGKKDEKSVKINLETGTPASGNLVELKIEPDEDTDDDESGDQSTSPAAKEPKNEVKQPEITYEITDDFAKKVKSATDAFATAVRAKNPKKFKAIEENFAKKGSNIAIFDANTLKYVNYVNATALYKLKPESEEAKKEMASIVKKLDDVDPRMLLLVKNSDFVLDEKTNNIYVKSSDKKVSKLESAKGTPIV